MSENCDRCGEVGDDRRTLVMRCGYNMNKLRVKFKQINSDPTLRVCKDCWVLFLEAIELWFNPLEKVGAGDLVVDEAAKKFDRLKLVVEEGMKRGYKAEVVLRLIMEGVIKL